MTRPGNRRFTSRCEIAAVAAIARVWVKGVASRSMRDCPSGSAASHLDLNVGAGDPHRVALDRLPSGRPEDGPGPDVELRPVPGTCHLAFLYRPLGQRPLSMGAGIAQGIEAPGHTKQGNLLALHLDQFGLLVCQFVSRGHLNELGHRSLLLRVPVDLRPLLPSAFLPVRSDQFFVVVGWIPGLSTKNRLFSSMKCFHCSGVSSSTKMAFTGQTGSQAPQSIHSSGWMKSWSGPS